MMVTMTTVSFYLIAFYTPTFGKTVLRLTAADSLLVTCCVGVSNFVWLPLIGALSDRVGRKPILIFYTALALVSTYPALYWLAATPNFPRMLGVDWPIAWLPRSSAAQPRQCPPG